MSSSTKSDKKKSKLPKTSGRFATPEEAADAKNIQLINRIKKIGLNIIQKDTASQ